MGLKIKILWTPKAVETFNQVVNYLSDSWTEKVTNDFVKKVNNTITLIEMGTVTFRPTGKKNIHEVPVTKHNLLIYRIKKTHIELLRFYDTRQNPLKKKF
jgi:plasmid stabilization system protein ParE